jgi:hypothetical protein
MATVKYGPYFEGEIDQAAAWYENISPDLSNHNIVSFDVFEAWH